MTNLLAVSADLALPLDTVTSTLVVYGGKGMGKTNLLAVTLEEMSKAGIRWCVVDPLGVLWGLRHSIDGHGDGIECLILGGVHGDIDIEPTGGDVVADLISDEDVNVIIDCSRDRNGQMWSVGQRVKFLTDLPMRLFQRQGSLIDGRRRPPRFVALDEAARYIPQTIPSGNKELPRCVGAWEQLAEEGRNVGLGLGLFTQRSARLNKSVAELADAMIAFRTTGPNSIAAIMDWLGEHVPKTEIKQHVEVVRKLPVGTALVVSPGWLDVERVVSFRARRTFDSSATPRPGEKPKRVSGKGAVVDLAAYRERMAATIERADANDPRVLRKQIAELREELELRDRALAAEQAKPSTVEQVEVQVPVLDEKLLIRLEEALTSSTLVDVLSEVQERLVWETEHRGDSIEFTRRMRQDVPRTGAAGDGTRPVGTGRRTAERADPPSRREPDRPPVPRATKTEGSDSARLVSARSLGDDEYASDGGRLSDSQAAILDALAWFSSVRILAPTRGQVAFQAGVSPKSSGFEKNLSTLRTRGLIDYPLPNRLKLTGLGEARATPPSTPATSEALQAAILSRLSGSQRAIVHALIDVYPGSLSREELADRAGVSAQSSGFEKNCSTLRGLGLADYPQQGTVAATELLFID